MNATATKEETLWCERGDHSWKREKKKGAKPKSCPKHWVPDARVQNPGQRDKYQGLKEEASRLREKNLEDSEIARRLNVGRMTVYRWLGPKGYRGHPPWKYDEAVRLRMKEGLKNKEISERLDVHEKTLYHWMGPTPKRLGGTGTRPDNTGLRSRARYLRGCGYTVTEISEQMSVARGTIGDWVHGMPCDL